MRRVGLRNARESLSSAVSLSRATIHSTPVEQSESSSLTSSRSILRNPEAQRIAHLFDEYPDLALKVVERLSADRRRYLLVAASASEWYGPKFVSSKVDQADVDGDDRISPLEYREWVEKTLELKRKIPWKTLVFVAINAGAPFVAFGFLDNSMMILFGDAIDGTFGERFALSAMGTAALGGVCSGGLGIQCHGAAERIVQRLPLFPKPKLSINQRKHPSVFRASHIGGTLGIMLGLSLGMFPLLYVGGQRAATNSPLSLISPDAVC